MKKIILTLIVFLSLPFMVLANGDDSHMMNFSFMPFGSWFDSVFMILFWGLIIFGIVVTIKWIIEQSKEEIKKSETALDILKKRYAKGEINKEEFNEKRKDLSS